MADHDSAVWKVQQAIEDHTRLVAQLGTDGTTELVAEVAVLAHKCLRSGGRLFLFGNGGSAADAAHAAAEFVGRCLVDHAPWPALALTEGSATVTALANDFGYEEVFSRQVLAHCMAADVVFGLSTSGRSRNVVRGLEAARTIGARTVALTGASPGPVGDAADHVLAVPSSSTARVQEIHHLWLHAVAEVVEASLISESPARPGR